MNMKRTPHALEHNMAVRHALDTTQSLEIWRETLYEGVTNDGHDLSQRQMAVLLTVYLRSQPHRVRDLSDHLKISKPAITRALDKLEQIGYVRRKPDEGDGRSVLIQRTVKGSVYLSEFAQQIQRAMDRQLHHPHPEYEGDSPIALGQ